MYRSRSNCDRLMEVYGNTLSLVWRRVLKLLPLALAMLPVLLLFDLDLTLLISGSFSLALSGTWLPHRLA